MQAAATNPEQLVEFCIELCEPIANAKPNAGHHAIADLEKHTRVTVITQNIDGLHQEAGSTCVREVHGSLFRIVDETRTTIRVVSRDELREVVAKLHNTKAATATLPALIAAVAPMFGTDAEGTCRPSLVLFGEDMAEPDWDLAADDARLCDVFISVGTSATVFPAAMLPSQAKSIGAKTIVIDPAGGDADLCLCGSSSKILPKLLANCNNP
jgi:NAD-dependent deacetylase